MMHHSSYTITIKGIAAIARGKSGKGSEKAIDFVTGRGDGFGLTAEFRSHYVY